MKSPALRYPPALLCTLLLLLAVPHTARAQAATAAQAASAPQPNTLELLTGRAGVRTCLPAARELGGALMGAPNAHAAVPMQPAQPQDGRMVSTTVERHDADGLHVVSTWLAPTQAGGCDVGYEVVTMWKKSCQDVLRQDVGGKTAQVIARDVQVVMHKPNHHLYLVRTPDGCLTINKEMIYR